MDEGGKGAEAILEEDETGDTASSSGAEGGPMTDILEQKEWEAGAPVAAEEKAAARERALRSLSGDWGAGNSHPPHKSTSRVSLTSATTTSSHRSHGPVLFTAHKEHHLFGTPSQPAPATRSFKSSYSSRPLRDVFSQDAAGDDEWVDDGEDLDSFGGGLGQGQGSGAAEGVGAGVGAGADSRMPDSPLAPGATGGHPSSSSSSGLFETGRRAFRAPVMTVEEEEEEEEE